MPRSNADLLALKSELTNDPLDLGLNTNPANDEANANALNLVRETISIKKRSLATAAVLNSISPLEHQALTDQQSRWLDAVLSLGQIDPFYDASLITGMIGTGGLFGTDSDSKAALAALIVEPGNRIDQLFQAGTLAQGGQVTPSDIANARNAS